MLRPHFSKEEMACKCCHGLPINGMNDALLDGLEKLRAIIGRPINVTNAYRCQHHNWEIGGVSNSQHVLGTAADIWVDGISSYELGQYCQAIFDGVGIYVEQDFVHVDMRDGGQSIGKYLWFE